MERVKCTILSGDAAVLELAASSSLRGVVHSVFKHAVNIRVHGPAEIVTLVSRTLSDAPNTLVADTPDFTGATLSADLPVVSNHGQIRLGEGLLLDCRAAKAWPEPELEYPADERVLRENMKHLYLKYHIVPAQDSESEQPLSAFAREASAMLRRSTAALAEALRLGDEQAALSETDNILGLGLGFTPSGDDIMLGFLGATNMRGAPAARFADFTRGVAGKAYRATNLVSAASIAQACAGRLNAVISGFLNALVCLPAPAPQLALHKVLALGSSSGADIAYGLLKGMELNLALGGAPTLGKSGALAD